MSDFDDFMNDTVIIEPFELRDSYGTASYFPPVSYACRISGAQKQVTDVRGVEVMSKATIYIMGSPVVGATDRLTLPAGNIPQQPPILVVNKVTDEAGDHHLEITV